MIAHDPLHGSGRAELPRPGWDRTQALYRRAAGSCCYRLLIGDCRCLVPRLGQFPSSPRFIPDGGIVPVRLGIAAFPSESSMMGSHFKRWHASFGYHQVCSKTRRVRLHQNASATVCRLVCVARPPLPRAPLLRRHYPPSSLLRAHARVLWPPCRFDLGLIGNGLRHLCHPRLVHRTVLALICGFFRKCRALCDGCSLGALVDFFPSECGLRQQEMARRAPSPPTNDFTRAPIFDAAGILFDYDPLVHSPPWSLPRSNTRRGLCRSRLLGIRFLLPSRASYPVESTNFRDRICTC
jgi:hypothetical protein